MTARTKQKAVAKNGDGQARTAGAQHADAKNGGATGDTENGMAMDGFAKACSAYLTGWATINGEIAGFMAKRFAQDAELGNALVKCENWEQAVDLQQDWARTAAQDYADEASRLMELSSTLATEQWQPVLDQAAQPLSEALKQR